MESTRILLLDTMMHLIKTLLGIATNLLDLYLTRSWHTFYQSHWFPDSYSWKEPVMNLLLGTMMHSIKTLLGIATSFLELYLTYVMTYFLSITLVPDSHSWMEPARILLLSTMMHPLKTLLVIAHWHTWPRFDLCYDLLSIHNIGSRLSFLNGTR